MQILADFVSKSTSVKKVYLVKLRVLSRKLAERMSCKRSEQLIRECVLPRSNWSTSLRHFLKSAICEKSLFCELRVLSRKSAQRMSCERSEQLIRECVLPRTNNANFGRLCFKKRHLSKKFT